MKTSHDLFELALDRWERMDVNLTMLNNSMIVGGAVRDLVMDRPIKDIDFVYNSQAIKFTSPATYKADEEILFDGLEKASLNVDLEAGGLYPAPAESHPFVVWNNPDRSFQLMQVSCKPRRFVVDTFDFGLCMIGMDYKGDIYCAKEFIEDMNNKTLTLYVRSTITKEQIGHSLKDHYPRILKKYPDFKLSVVHKSVYEESWKKLESYL